MSPPHPIRMLITGFGPFPGVPHNPTSDLVQWLADEAPLQRRNIEAVTRVLPVEWETGAAQLRALLESHAPHVVLQFGASRRATGFRIEQVARNRTSFMADVKGQRAEARTILPGAPPALRAALPGAPLAIHLQRLGLPATVSTDAGAYLCNALFFHALNWARQQKRVAICQFVHVPAEIAAEAEPLTWSGLQRGALTLIASLTATARRRERPTAAPALG